MVQITCELTVDARTVSKSQSMNQFSNNAADEKVAIKAQSTRGKPILITAAKKADRDMSKSKRRRLQKVYFRLPKTRKKWWKFEPFDSRSRFVARWKIFMLLPLCVEVWIFPYRLALGVPSISSEMQIILAEFVVDILCLMDMLITLCTALPPSHDELGTTFSGISRNYFRSTFLWEILPTYPYWVALFFATNEVQSVCKSGTEDISWHCVRNSKSGYIYLWWSFSALRVAPRLWRVVRDFKNMESNLEMTVRALQALKFAMMIFLTTHWVGCISYFIALNYDLGWETWVFEMEYLLPFFKRYSSSTADTYLLCLYKGLNDLTNLEYILEYPNNLAEQIFAIIVMVVSVWLEGNILGTLLNYMVDKDPVAEAHKKEMEELWRFIETKNLPPELAARLVNHFEFQHLKAVENRASSSVQLPRSLMMKVSECKYREVLDKSTARGEIFFGCEPQFLSALLMKLKVVFYMPNEEVFKKDDLSRELCFVLHGACNLIDEDKIKRVVRHDVPNMPPVLGELAFFFGIVQPLTVRARSDGDVQLLVLSREEGHDLFNSYPEELTKICANILQTFGLDRKGQEIAQGIDDENGDMLILKNAIKNAMAKQQYETFRKLTSAAKAGELDVIRDLLRCGAELDAVDYDGRSAFAVACYEGSYKVVELLLEEGVDTNTKNRWSKTPLNEAMSNRQGPVVELLLQWKAGTDPDQGPAELRSAASRGDLDELKRLILSGLDPNVCDYDMRTAIHLASAMKHSDAVEFLIECKADVNSKDRWGCTPLEDAVSAGDEQLALLLRAKGGNMSETVAVSMVCSAATQGDVKKLNLLLKSAGLQPNVGDFDQKGPLHFAAEEARLLAVSFLMSNAANPNMVDRWGNTPLDLALKGNSIFHLYCARLIYGWGGKLGFFAGKVEGNKRMDDMMAVDMDDVRMRVQSMLSKRQDLQSPFPRSVADNLLSCEASMHIVQELYAEDRMHVEIAMVSGINADINKLFQFIGNTFLPCLALVPLKRWRKAGGIQNEFRSMLRSLTDQKNEDAIDFEDTFCAIDSEEEERLFEELDQLLDIQERAEAFRGNQYRFMANSFQKAFLRILELEDSMRKVCDAFRDRKQSHGEPVIKNPETIVHAMRVLAMPEPALYELEEIISSGIKCAESVIPDAETDQSPEMRVPVQCLISGSEKFRQIILKTKTDPIFCSVMKSQLVDFLPPQTIKRLSRNAKEIDISRSEKMIYNAKNGDKSWFVLLSGTLKASLCHVEGPEACCDISEGDIFGGFNPNEESDQFFVETVEAARYIEFPWSDLERFSESGDTYLSRLLSILGGFSWSHLANKTKKNDLGSDGKKNSGHAKVKEEQVGWLGDRGAELGGSSKSFAAAAARRIGSFRRIESNKTGTSESVKNFSKGSSGDITPHDEDHGFEVYSEMELHEIKTAFLVIENLWKDISLGTDHISVSVLLSIHQQLGEIGSELFGQIFLPNMKKINEMDRITANEFWLRWMSFLSKEAFNSENDLEGLVPLDRSSDFDEEELPDDEKEPLSYQDKDAGCYEALHARYAPSRRIQKMLFEEHVADRYESAYLLVSGDLKKSISVKKIPELLDTLFPTFPHQFSSYNVREFLEAFGRHGSKSSEVFWSDIRKALREKKSSASAKKSSYFILSALHPKSKFIEWWHLFMKALGTYYFISVPIRIAFLQWDTMLHVEALGWDLTADCLCFLNMILIINTAYLDSSNTWITNRIAIARNSNFGYFFAAAPFDWFAFLCGASNQLSCWLRIPKLILIYITMSPSKESTTSEKTAGRRILNLACIVFGVIHIASCIWFYIGSQYKYWNPEAAISWYYVADNLKSISYTHHEDKFGLQADATLFEQYVVSFYWVSATFTVNGLVGDVIPNNNLEIVFTMILMILNLTLFRYVTGEVSSVVMKADENVVKARAGLEATETFLKDSRIGNDLRENIRQHYKLSLSNSFVDQTALFSRMSHSLRTEVSSVCAREYLDNVSLFQGCSEKLLDAISVLLREVQFSPEEYLYRAGEVAHSMFFVVSGSVDEVTDLKKGGVEKIERSLHRGRGTGDLAFFFGIRHIVCAKGHRLTGAICLRLPRTEFLAVLEHYPEDEERIAQSAMISMDVQSQMSRSIRSGSVARSDKSGSRKSSHSSTSKKNSKEDAEIGSDFGLDVDESDESDGGSMMRTDAVSQRVEAMKIRRRNERTNLVLSLAAKGDSVGMKRALKNDNVNMCDGLKRTPLHVASSEGKVDVVKFLLDGNAEVNAEDQFKNTSLNDAVRHKHDEVCQVLRERGGKMVFEKNAAGVLLCQASLSSDLAEVKRLIINGIPPSAADDNGRTPLHIAASEGHIELVKYLLDSQADVNARDKKNGSPLDDAIRHGRLTIQALLRSHGGTVNIDACAVRMCEYAASGNVEGIKLLVENGVDCSICTKGRRTAAHLAACHGMISVLDFLIAQGDKFDINSVDDMGGTPLEDARRHGRRVAAILLEDHGGVMASDSSIPALRQAQETRKLEDDTQRRRPAARRLADQSAEMRAWRLIQDSYVPGLRRAGTDLQTRAAQMQAAMGTAVGVIEDVLWINGLLPNRPVRPNNLDSNGSSSVATAATKKSPSKVLEDLVAKLSAFASSVSATSEAINSDFPRRGSLRIVVRDFLLESRALRKRLKVCLDLVKLIKRVLQEVQALSQAGSLDATEPGPGRRFSMAAGTPSSVPLAAAALTSWRFRPLLRSGSYCSSDGGGDVHQVAGDGLLAGLRSGSVGSDEAAEERSSNDSGRRAAPPPDSATERHRRRAGAWLQETGSGISADFEAYSPALAAPGNPLACVASPSAARPQSDFGPRPEQSLIVPNLAVGPLTGEAELAAAAAAAAGRDWQGADFTRAAAEATGGSGSLVSGLASAGWDLEVAPHFLAPPPPPPLEALLVPPSPPPEQAHSTSVQEV